MRLRTEVLRHRLERRERARVLLEQRREARTTVLMLREGLTPEQAAALAEISADLRNRLLGLVGQQLTLETRRQAAAAANAAMRDAARRSVVSGWDVEMHERSVVVAICLTASVMRIEIALG